MGFKSQVVTYILSLDSVSLVEQLSHKKTIFYWFYFIEIHLPIYVTHAPHFLQFISDILNLTGILGRIKPLVSFSWEILFKIYFQGSPWPSLYQEKQASALVIWAQWTHFFFNLKITLQIIYKTKSKGMVKYFIKFFFNF